MSMTYDIENDTERHTVPPITCAPWCEQGDGHPDDILVEDQICWGPDSRTVTANGEIIATLCRRPGGVTHVYVAVESTNADFPVAQMALSPEAFREWLAMAERNVLAVLDETGGAEQ